MTDKAPERIWAWRYTGKHSEGQWNRSKLSHAESEYIRADIHESLVADTDALREMNWKAVIEALEASQRGAELSARHAVNAEALHRAYSASDNAAILANALRQGMVAEND